MLRIGLVVDASGSYNANVLAHPALALVPVRLEVDGKAFLDEKNAEFTRSFNRQYLNIRAAEVSRSVSMSEDEIFNFFLSNMSTRFDHVFGMFVMSSRSPLFKQAFAASSRVIAASMPARMKQGLKGPLFVESHDSMNVADGYGVQVQEVLRLIDAGQSAGAVRQRMAAMTKEAYTYVAPSQLDFIATRAKARGDKSAGTMTVLAAKMLGLIPVMMAAGGETKAVAKVRGVDKAREHVLGLARRELAKGLLAPFISASFSGDIALVEALPAWRALAREAQAAAVALTLTEMSPAAAINLGPDSLCVGFLAKPHSPEL